MAKAGGRFFASYSIKGNKPDAHEKAREICIEQTVEFPPRLIEDKYIKNNIIGRLESFTKISATLYSARISYADSTAGDEITQLLNVLFGNTSLKPGIRLDRIELSRGLSGKYKGPRFGIAGLRKLVHTPYRPLLASALKPMGLDSKSLAALAFDLALAGIDIIKDDHGLANQEFSRFRERVSLCAGAVARANTETGGNTLYAPNVTADGNEVMARARSAKMAGAQALVVSPGLSGFHAIRALREDSSVSLPIFFHPAFLGTYVASKYSGISHYALFGQIPRICGADAVIFPNFGGRFSFSRQECASIVSGAKDDIGRMKPLFPMPGGGINLSNVTKLKSFYGNDVIFLVGGGLFEYDRDIAKSVAYFKSLVS